MYITVEVAAKARAARQIAAKKANPAFNASEAQLMGSPGTTALYLTTMWDEDAGAAPKAWVRSFFGKLVGFFFFLQFRDGVVTGWRTTTDGMDADCVCGIEKERIPYRLGYKMTPKNGTTIGKMFEAVLAVPV